MLLPPHPQSQCCLVRSHRHGQSKKTPISVSGFYLPTHNIDIGGAGDSAGDSAVKKPVFVKWSFVSETPVACL